MRDRFALALAGAATALLLTVLLFALTGARPLDTLVIGATALLQVIVLIVWIALPWIPRWLFFGYGLIAIAMGIGFTLTGPSTTAAPGTGGWAFWTLLIVGVLMMLASLFHRAHPSAGGHYRT